MAALISSRCRLMRSGNDVIAKFLQVVSQPTVHRAIATSTVCRQCSPAEEGEGHDDLEGTTSKFSRQAVDHETSIRYLESKAYTEAYGDKPVWFHYRRNFKGQRAPETRKTCIRKGQISTGSPCPICRDDHLTLHYKNVKLLEQFISPFTGEVLETKKTGVCQKQHRKLQVEVMKAQDHGYLEKNVPFRVYDYSQYWDPNTGKVL